MSDAALAAWRSRGHLRDEARFEAWFGRILVNVCRDRLRSRARHPIAEVPASEIGDSAAHSADFRDAVQAHDAMSRAFETLEPDERIVLVLRFWHDLTIEAIVESGGSQLGPLRGGELGLRGVLGGMGAAAGEGIGRIPVRSR